MTRILIVDDEPTNRDLLRTLLGYAGYAVDEAADGAQALELVRDAPPDLIIADILMPTMDGYELVRRLRAEPARAAMPVVFYTAHYLEREARELAAQCGVHHLLTKPAEPEVILATVRAALGAPPAAADPPSAAPFEQAHLQLVSDTLARKVEELQHVNQRLTALIAVSERLASEREPARLLEAVTRAARRVVGARHALIAVLDNGHEQWRHLLASGLPAEVVAQLSPPAPHAGRLGALLGDVPALRLGPVDLSAAEAGLPAAFPRVRALLGVRVTSLTRRYGWLCLTDKLGGEAFSEADERLAVIIGSLAGRVYENGSLYVEVRQRAGALEAEIEERKQAEAALRLRTRMAMLVADIGSAVTHGAARPELLATCVAAVARHLPDASAAVWAPAEAGGTLRVQADAGEHAGPSFAALAAPAVEDAAAARRAVVRYDAAAGGGPATDWARAQGLATLAALPLCVDDHCLGVLAVCSRQPFAQAVLDGLGTAADAIAVGVQRAETAAALSALTVELEQRVRERTAELDAANRELEAFSYSVSHDLRGPLRHIDGFSRVLLADHAAQLDADGRHQLERIVAGAQRMARLIEDLLGLAQVTRREMRREPVALSELAAAIVEELRGAAPARNVAVTIEPHLAVVGDAALLRIALANLLENAWKYSGRRPDAAIAFGAVTLADGGRAFFVRDNGAGFDMAHAEHLFAPFRRLHAASEFEGTGIGLATVQRIITRHGGRIWAESAPDAGSTFWFTLGVDRPARGEGP